MPYRFYKLTAAGNDFILFYNSRDLKFSSNLIRYICDRHYGVGGDGILILDSKKDGFYLKYFNPDGSVSFCGNGTRSAAFFIFKKIYGGKKKSFDINTVAGRLKIIIRNGKIFTEMPSPDFITDIFIKNKWDFSKMCYLKAGTYHLVIETENISKIDVLECGRFFRYHKNFRPHGTNVDFIKIEKLIGRKVICNIRTYEKGVEDETLSCSSGIASSFYYLRDKYSIQKAVFISRNGEKFYLEFENSKLYLNGPVKLVFEGRLL